MSAALGRREPTPSPAELLAVFSRIGLTSFGGGLSGWLLREVVQRRGWLGEEEFLTGLSLSQAFPGVNVVNLAIWIGFRLQGTTGALAATTGIIVPPAVLVVLVGVGFAALSRFPSSHLVLDGVGAAAVGLSLQIGLVAARRAGARGGWSLVLMVLAFIAVGVLHLSLPVVVVVLGAVGVGLAYRDLRRG